MQNFNKKKPLQELDEQCYSAIWCPCLRETSSIAKSTGKPKKKHRKGVTCKLVLTFKYTHKHNTNNNVLLDPNCCRPIRPLDRAEERRLQTVRLFVCYDYSSVFFSSSSSFRKRKRERSMRIARRWKDTLIAFLSRTTFDRAHRETMR